MNDGRTIAIIAHVTIIGWVIALIMNGNEKTEFGSFYIRQMLGLYIIAVLGGIIPFFNLLVALVVFIFWLMSLLSAVNGERREIPGIGPLFQDWFKAL